MRVSGLGLDGGSRSSSSSGYSSSEKALLFPCCTFPWWIYWFLLRRGGKTTSLLNKWIGFRSVSYRSIRTWNFDCTFLGCALRCGKKPNPLICHSFYACAGTEKLVEWDPWSRWFSTTATRSNDNGDCDPGVDDAIGLKTSSFQEGFPRLHLGLLAILIEAIIFWKTEAQQERNENLLVVRSCCAWEKRLT